MRGKSRVIVLIILLLTAVLIWLFSKQFSSIVPEQSSYQVISLNDIEFDIARTAAEKERGLSGRGSLATSSGMLFVFEFPGLYGFWMKDMKFPIDIIWLDQNLIVVDLESGVSPSTYPRSFIPQAKSLYVAELNAGEALRRGIKIGSKISIMAVDNSK